MIKLDGHFTFSFSLGDNEEGRDFITVYNLKSLKLFEAAGNCRPIIHLTFELENPKLIKYLNAGNILTVSFGINEPNKEYMQFELYNDDTNINLNLGYETTIKGAMYLPKFTSKVGSKFYENKTSLQVIQEIADENKLNLKTNISKMNDRQNWCREGQTQWEFMRDVWLPSYINDDTFMIYGFDYNNIYFYDMKSLCSQEAKWTFSTEYISSGDSNIVNIGGVTTKNIYGSLSDLVGKNLINRVYNIDTGEFYDVNYNLKNFTAIDTNKLNLNSTDCQDYDYFIISSDMHENYVKAWNQNLRNNIMYSSFNIYAPTAGQFKRLHLLDTVRFDVKPKDERLSGLAFITGITYQYEFGAMNINITLNKEAPSGIKGDDLEVGA